MSAFIRRMIVSVLVPDADCRPFLVKWLLSGCETIRSMTLLINEIFETGLYLLKVFVSNLVFFQTWSNKCTFQLIWNDPSIRWSIHQFSYGRQHCYKERCMDGNMWTGLADTAIYLLGHLFPHLHLKETRFRYWFVQIWRSCIVMSRPCLLFWTLLWKDGTNSSARVQSLIPDDKGVPVL